MYRCVQAACFGFAVLAAATLLPSTAQAQVQRNFPQNALRGVVVFVDAPDITVNGVAARLAPGARIRDQNNLLALPAALAGAKLRVNYTIDTYGLVKDVWILRPDEAAVKPWPTSASQAEAWSFDPVAQTWARP